MNVQIKKITAPIVLALVGILTGTASARAINTVQPADPTIGQSDADTKQISSVSCTKDVDSETIYFAGCGGFF